MRPPARSPKENDFRDFHKIAFCPSAVEMYSILAKCLSPGRTLGLSWPPFWLPRAFLGALWAHLGRHWMLSGPPLGHFLSLPGRSGVDLRTGRAP